MTDEQIIAAIGFENVPDDVKSKTIDSIRRTVDMRVIGIIGEMIDDDQESQLETLIEAGDNQAVWEWLKNDVVGVDTREIYEATLQDYIANHKDILAA